MFAVCFITSAAVKLISCMDVHMQDIWREKGAAYSSAQPPTGKPISCCQVQCFDAVESFKRREPAVVTPPTAFLSSLWRSQNGRSCVKHMTLPPCPLCLSVFTSRWAWKSPISFSSSHFVLLFPAWQTAGFTPSLKAATRNRVAAIPTTLKGK